MKDITITSNQLIQGDPLEPYSTDLIAQSGLVDASLPVPDGWRVISGNYKNSTVSRVAMRHEIVGDDPSSSVTITLSSDQVEALKGALVQRASNVQHKINFLTSSVGKTQDIRGEQSEIDLLASILKKVS